MIGPLWDKYGAKLDFQPLPAQNSRHFPVEAFYLWYSYTLLVYRDILRPAGPKYTPIY